MSQNPLWKKSECYPKLTVHDKIMHQFNEEKYLGDYIHIYFKDNIICTGKPAPRVNSQPLAASSYLSSEMLKMQQIFQDKEQKAMALYQTSCTFWMQFQMAREE